VTFYETTCIYIDATLVKISAIKILFW